MIYTSVFYLQLGKTLDDGKIEDADADTEAEAEILLAAEEADALAEEIPLMDDSAEDKAADALALALSDTAEAVAEAEAALEAAEVVSAVCPFGQCLLIHPE